MSPIIGQALLVLSGMGFPMSQAVLRRFGRGGAVVVEAVAVGLLARDVALVASGAPRLLRRGPAILLGLETGAAALAAAATLPLLGSAVARERALATRPAPAEALRRFALGLLFGLHTLRFRIYLGPDHGLRAAPFSTPGGLRAAPASVRPRS
jgi:hypothetical protein